MQNCSFEVAYSILFLHLIILFAILIFFFYYYENAHKKKDKKDKIIKSRNKILIYVYANILLENAYSFIPLFADFITIFRGFFYVTAGNPIVPTPWYLNL